MKNLVSIIVPIYNVSRFLPKCIESLLSQTYENLQIILVNDGSKDDSLEIAQKYAKIDSRIVVIDKTNAGSAHTRNTGLNFLLNQKDKKTDYICFIDSDDYVSKYFVETLYTSLTKNKADISVVKDARVSEKQDLEFKHIFNKEKFKCENFDNISAMQQLFSGKKFGVGPCNKMYKYELLNGQNLIRFPEDIFYSEDIPFVYNAFSKADKVTYVPVANYAYTKRNGSNVRSKVSERKLTTFKGLNYCVESCKHNIPNAHSYVAGWRVLGNFEILFYMFRDKYFDYDVYLSITNLIKRDMKFLKKSKGFPLYRRMLLPFGTWLLKTCYKNRFKKEFKQIKIKQK